MPRHFFHRTDGAFDADDEGTGLPDLDTARIEAISFAAETLVHRPEQASSGSAFRIEVSDGNLMLLSTVVILEIESVQARALRETAPLPDRIVDRASSGRDGATTWL